jgi:hypothetical protein
VKRILILCAVVLAAQLTSRAEGPRIGILSDAGARKEADLLMIELQKAKCELVERDEIKNVVSEQALQAGLNRTESLRVGQMLKADGLILMSAATNNIVTVRIVAVAPGVVVWFADVETKDKAKAAVTMATTISGYLPKLTVAKGAAVPVSLLRVRPSFGTPLAVHSAHELNRLLQLRLVREPSLFVLERENLRVMDEEQRWAGKGSAFWAGSFVVEGTVAHDLVNTNQVTLTLMIRPPGTSKASPATVIEESGKPGELVGLVDRITPKACAAFGASAQAPAWDALTEGNAFFASAMQLAHPAERRVALESAMALGCRDARVASEYRETLKRMVPQMNLIEAPPTKEQARDAAVIAAELLAFCADYRPPGDSTGKQEGDWLYDSALNPSPSAWAKVSLFLRGMADAGRVEELGELLAPLLAEGRRLGNRVFCEERRDVARRCYQAIHFARAYYHTTAELRRIFELMYLPSPATGLQGVWAPGPVRARDFEPLFKTDKTESAAMRQEMYEAFQKALAGATDRPEVRLHAALTRYREAPPGEKRQRQRQLQEEMIAQHAYLAKTRFFATAYMFWMPAFPNDRQAASESLREDAVPARQLFLAMVGDGQSPSECGGLVSQYLGFYTLAEAQAVYQAIRAHTEQVAGKQNEETFKLVKTLVAKFPELADAAHSAQVAMRDTAAQQRFQVRLTIPLPAGNGKNDTLRREDPGRWREGKFWCFWQVDVIGLDFQTRQPEVIAAPRGKGEPRLEVTDNFFVLAFNEQKAGELCYRQRLNGQWHSVKTPFTIWSAAEVAGKLYCLAEAPSVGMGLQTPCSIIEVDPATGSISTVFDPLRNPKPERATPEGALLDMGRCRLSATKDELLVCRDALRGVYCAWNPATKTWRKVKQEVWNATLTEELASAAASRPFGFEILFWSTSAFHCDAGLGLRIQRTGAKQHEVIPLAMDAEPFRPSVFNRETWEQQFTVRVCAGAVILTPTGVLIPHIIKRGFWEIPYADIQKWLAANPPAADKPVPKASGSAPVPSAPAK